MLGPHGRHRPGALHPLHALRPLHARGREGAAARRGGARERELHHDVPRPAARLEVRRQRRRHLPGGRAHLDGLPLPRPRLVHERGALGVHRLRARLQHVPRLPERHDLPLPPARERRRQPGVDVRRRPGLVQVPEPRAGARRARGARRPGEDARRARPPSSAPPPRWRRTRARAAWRCCSRRSRRSRTCSPPRPSRRRRSASPRCSSGGRPRRLAGRLPEARRREPEPQGAGARRRRRSGSPFGRSAISPRRSRRARSARSGRSGPRSRMRRPRPRSRGRRCSSRRPTATARVARQATRAPAGVAALGERRDVRELRGSGAALRARLLPAGRLAAALAARVASSAARWGSGTAFATARDVFAELGTRLGAALGEFRWDSLPSTGRRRGLIPLAAGTVDGRLPGYRERVPPETSEDARRALARTT